MEDQAALAGIQERKRPARELCDFEMKETLKIEDLDERRVAQARALGEQRRADLDAELEAEVKIAEMRRQQQVENARNMAGSQLRCIFVSRPIRCLAESVEEY
jgi:citrate lyase synthetase